MPILSQCPWNAKQIWSQVRPWESINCPKNKLFRLIILNQLVELLGTNNTWDDVFLVLKLAKNKPKQNDQSGSEKIFSILLWSSPRRRQWHPTPVLLPGKSHGRRSLVGCRLLRVGHNWVTSLTCIGEGNGNPFQCSCLENPRDGGAWWAAVYGVAQSRTRLKRLSSSSCWSSHMMGPSSWPVELSSVCLA